MIDICPFARSATVIRFGKSHTWYLYYQRRFSNQQPYRLQYPPPAPEFGGSDIYSRQVTYVIAAEHEGASMAGEFVARVLLLQHGNDDLARRKVLDELIDRPERGGSTVRGVRWDRWKFRFVRSIIRLLPWVVMVRVRWDRSLVRPVR